MLRTYETEVAICEAIDDFREVRQSPTGNKMDYAARLNRYAYYCGNVHTEEDKITSNVNRIEQSIRTIVSPYRNNQPSYELTLERLVQFARNEREAICRRETNLPPGIVFPTTRASLPTTRASRAANQQPIKMVTFTEHSSDSLPSYSKNLEINQELRLFEEGRRMDISLRQIYCRQIRITLRFYKNKTTS